MKNEEEENSNNNKPIQIGLKAVELGTDVHTTSIAYAIV